MSALAPVAGSPLVRRLAMITLALCAAAAVAGAASGRVIPVGASLAVVALLALAVAAQRWPRQAMSVAIVVVALVPVYWGRPTLGKSLVAVPATIAALALLPAAVGEVRKLRLMPIDMCYGGFLLALSLAGLLNVHHGIGAALGIAWRYLLPYIVWRLITLRWLSWAAVARVFALAGTTLAGFALQEHATATNPFFSWVHPTYQGDQWARSTFRHGAIRVEASFGEPISFGLFLGVCVVAALTVALISHRVAEQLLAVGAIVVMTIAIIDTQSRAALVAVVAAVAVQLLRLISRTRVRRVAAVFVLAVGALIATPLGAQLQAALHSTSGDSREALSAQYRLAVVNVLTEPSQWSVLGHRNDQASGVSDLGVRESGLKSLDNEYAYALVTGGALALIALIALALVLLWSAIASRDRDPVARAFMTSTAVVSVVLLSVALLTQFADIFGIVLAMLATQSQRVQPVRRPA
jgi:hypothetical protein